MVLADLKKIKDKTNLHKTRISDNGIFWIAVLIVIALSHYYLYCVVGVHLNGWLEASWLFVGAVAILSSAAVRRLGLPKRKIGNVSFQSAIHRFGASWNIFVFFVSLFMVLLRYFAAFSVEASFWIACGIAFCLSAYGIYEARTVRTVKIEMLTTKKVSPSGRLRIAQLTDLHIGPFMNLKHVARVVDKLLAARPDMIVITGDLVDGAVGDAEGVSPFYVPFAAELARLAGAAPALGVWAVPGNHDHYEGFGDTRAFIEMSHISLLLSETRDLGDIVVIGADDQDHIRASSDNARFSRSEQLVHALSAEERAKFTLLLRHRPIVESSTLGMFDLQLSGHTHGGQLFSHPSSRHKIPGCCKGLMHLRNGSFLYVSNGAGFVGPPMRFLAPAEIVVIDLLSID